MPGVSAKLHRQRRGSCVRNLAGIAYHERYRKRREIEADRFTGKWLELFACPRRTPQQMIDRGGERRLESLLAVGPGPMPASFAGPDMAR